MAVKTPYLIAIGISAAIAGWFYYGDIIQGGNAGAKPPTIRQKLEQQKKDLFQVQVTSSQALDYVEKIEIRGSTHANQNISVRSETTGMLNKRHVKKGSYVKQGDLICSLNVGDRLARVEQAQAELKKAKIDFESASELVKGGFATKARINENKATLEAATAALKSAEIELQRTQIKAPISGIVQDPFAKVGDMLQIGDTCANVMNLQSMTMIAQVSERFINRLSLNDPVLIKIVTDKSVNGKISYIAPSSDQETRTFRVEIDLPNKNGDIKNGITTKANVNLPSGKAHLLQASSIVLNDAGKIGIRIVDDKDQVRFQPVKILDDRDNGVYVAGLPEKLNIITRGQDYVIDGQKVTPSFVNKKVTQ